jgi:ribosomal protein L11 methyltransferase
VLALVVSAPQDEVEVASDVLWSLGVVAIEERVVAERVVELWTSIGDDLDDVTNVAALKLQRWPWRCVEVDESVADTWRDHAEPVWIDSDLVVCPTWVPFEQPRGVTVLRIEPGSTFGLGDHPTTVLSLRALRRALRTDATVLDVGSGSGVLAVGACVLGASTAIAIDIAPASVSVARANAIENGVVDRVQPSTTSLTDIDRTFDIVVANILAPTLIELADDLVRVTASTGVLIVSGVLIDRHQHVEDALRPLTRVRRDTLDGWAAITLSHGAS